MTNWKIEDEKEREYTLIPQGKHRARIKEITAETSQNSGNKMFKIIFDVSGYSGSLWYYFVFNEANRERTMENIAKFCSTFGIEKGTLNPDVAPNWKGKVGGVEVVHELYNGENKAKVKWIMFKSELKDLPAWKNAGETTQATEDISDEIPFS